MPILATQRITNPMMKIIAQTDTGRQGVALPREHPRSTCRWQTNEPAITSSLPTSTGCNKLWRVAHVAMSSTEIVCIYRPTVISHLSHLAGWSPVRVAVLQAPSCIFEYQRSLSSVSAFSRSQHLMSVRIVSVHLCSVLPVFVYQ